MSLTVFDVTVRSSAIIMLSMGALWFVNRARIRGHGNPLVMRVDNKRTNFYQPLPKQQTLKSAGFLGLGALAIGIFGAVIVSVLAALAFSTLTRSLGN